MSTIGIIIIFAIPIIFIIINVCVAMYNNLDLFSGIITSMLAGFLGIATNCLIGMFAYTHASKTPVLETNTVPITVVSSEIDNDDERYYYRGDEGLEYFTSPKLITDNSLPVGYYKISTKRKGNFITGEYTYDKYIYNTSTIN